MYRRIMLCLWFMFTMLAVPSLAADTGQGLTADYVTRIQTEISSDIAKLRPAALAQLEGMSLTSSDIRKRISELAALTDKASDDMSSY